MIKHEKYSLTRRDKKVLKATIDEFITLNQPVGSKFLKEQYTFRFSPATIRNILSKLESYNLLTHIYTSSGRTPTNQGIVIMWTNLIQNFLHILSMFIIIILRS